MATRDQLYAKFGLAAEAAQLFETELGTLILCLRGLENGWHVEPNGKVAATVLVEIDRSTLGRLLKMLQKHAFIEDNLENRFSSALAARNRLTHGFYERHNFKIQTDLGRDEMIDDLEILHEELFQAWQIAGAMATIVSDIIHQARSEANQP